MYRYVADVSAIAHSIIENNCIERNLSIDATLGNGNDSIFLSNMFDEVISFEIQSDAIENFKKKKAENITIIHDSHEKIDHYITPRMNINCIMYNLGYLPGGDKNLTTTAKSTLRSVEKSLLLLSSKGIMSIISYVGHEEGRKEKYELEKLLNLLPKNQYGVMKHEFINRLNSPYLYIVERN